ncbi:MAG: glycosyltransferase family 39 protein [Deltaproteobacteria bacterium]|nr:glycosyltransferase family 39 protein [Deltaproteobacteria bacterium]
MAEHPPCERRLGPALELWRAAWRQALAVSAAPATVWVSLGVVALLLLVVTLPLVGVAAADSRMAAVFSSDEELIADGARRMVSMHTLTYAFYYYPPFFMELTYGATWFLKTVGVPLQAAAVIGPRVVAALAYVLGAVGVGGLGRRLSGSLTVGLVAALLFATVPELFRFAILAHPDTLQAALLVLGTWALVVYLEAGGRRALIAAAAAAGLAFMTKYAGAFLVPVVGLAIGWRLYRDRRPEPAPGALGRAFLRDSGVAALAFVLAGIAGGLDLVRDVAPYWRYIKFHSDYSRFGNLVRETASPLHWLELLAGEQVAGRTTTLAFALGLFALAGFAWQLRRSRPPAAVAIAGGTPASGAAYVLIALYVALYLGFLFWRARLFEARYLIPVSGLFEVAAVGLMWAATARLRARAVRALMRGALVVAFGLALVPRGPALAAIVRERLSHTDHPCLAVGGWLVDHVPRDTAIVYDMYTYVPVGFRNVAGTWGLQRQLLDARRAAVVITNDSIRSRYRADIDPGDWHDGAANFVAARAAYDDLEHGRLDDFERVAEFPRCAHTRIYVSPRLATRLGP